MSPSAHLPAVLRTLAAHPPPPLPSPPTVPKRASVALVIRYNPHPSHLPPADTPPATTLDAFFALDWVQHATPEILFIKRAARPGDRWTSQIALPGGKRDPTDASDLAAAVRECREEVGLDLTTALPAGNLPDRVIATGWGTVPLMTLCAYVFVLPGDSGRLVLQPSEVAAAHWAPVELLCAERYRDVVRADVADRLMRRKGMRRVRPVLRALVGEMRFPAVRLRPAESVFAVHACGFADEMQDREGLRMWGVTLGVVGDLVDCLLAREERRPRDAIRQWWGTWPGFSRWDVRFWGWLMTRGIRKENARGVEERGVRAWVAQEGGMARVEAGIDLMLERGYWERVGWAAWVAMAVRVGVVAAAWRWWAKSRR